MTKTSRPKGTANRETVSGEKTRPYYFPDIGTGITVHATSIEEANKKAEALVEARQNPVSSSNE